MEYGHITIANTGVFELGVLAGNPQMAFRASAGTGINSGSANMFSLSSLTQEIMRVREDGGGSMSTVQSRQQDAVQIHSGTTAQQPSTSVNGMIRYNSTIGTFEGRYNGSWEVIGGYVPDGTRASPVLVTGTITISHGDFPRMYMFIEGNGGGQTMSANPQIAAGTNVGQELLIQGRDDTNIVRMLDGNGLSLNGNIQFNEDVCMLLVWDGTNWTEVMRST